MIAYHTFTTAQRKRNRHHGYHRCSLVCVHSYRFSPVLRVWWTALTAYCKPDAAWMQAQQTPSMFGCARTAPLKVSACIKDSGACTCNCSCADSCDSCASILHLMMSYRMVERTSDSCACSGARCPRLCSSHSQSSCSPALRLPSSDAAWGVRLRSVLRPYVRPTFTVGRSCMHCAIRRQSTAWRHWRSRQLTLFVVYLLYKWNYMCKVFFWLLAGFETYVR